MLGALKLMLQVRGKTKMCVDCGVQGERPGVCSSPRTNQHHQKGKCEYGTPPKAQAQNQHTVTLTHGPLTQTNHKAKPNISGAGTLSFLGGFGKQEEMNIC